jgi:hypothetical protein
VGCSITIIDALPASIAAQVQTLYLSNNDITSLGGVAQFSSSIRSLSLANNLVRYLGQLRALRDLSVLEKLSLEGNPVASMPFYRVVVLGLCPRLTTLDGKKVSSQERVAVKANMAQVTRYFDLLRTNELRIVVLQHLAGSLRSHTELCDFLRPLPQSNGGVSSVEVRQQNLQHSTAAAIKMLLDGGVFRWLQVSGEDHSDCIVHSLVASLSSQILQRLPSSQRTALLGGSSSSSSGYGHNNNNSNGSGGDAHGAGMFRHWQGVVEGTLRYQQELMARLYSACEVQKGSSVGAAEAGLQGMSVLRFVNSDGGDHGPSASDSASDSANSNSSKARLEAEYEAWYHGPPKRHRLSRYAAAAGGGRLSQSMSDRYKRILRDQKKQQQQQQLEEGGRKGASSGNNNHNSLDDSLVSVGSHMLPPQQTVPESPLKAVGAAALSASTSALSPPRRQQQQQQQPGGNYNPQYPHPGGNNNPQQQQQQQPERGRPSLAHSPPPRHHSPNFSGNNGGSSRQVGSPSRAGTHSLSALDSKLDFSDESVVAFLNRSLHAASSSAAIEESGVLGRDIVGEWLHACAAAKALVKLDAPVGLDIRLGPNPHRSEQYNNNGGGEARSMGELKEQVQQALDGLTVSQRESYMCWSIAEALRKQADKVRTVMGVAEEKASSKLELYYRMLKVLDGDVTDGDRWVQSVQPLLVEVEQGKGHLTDLKNALDDADASRARLVGLKEEEKAKKGAILSSIHEANLAIQAMSAQLFKNPRLPKKVAAVHSILDRVEELENRSSLLVVRVFRHWRWNVRHAKHIASFTRKTKVKQLKRLRQEVFHRWRGCLGGAYRRKLVGFRVDSRLLGTFFDNWSSAFHASRVVSKHLSRKNERTQRHVFRQLEAMFVCKHRAAKKARDGDAIVTCFTLVRVYRAWKAHYLRSRLSVVDEGNGSMRAAAHFLRTRFEAWRTSLYIDRRTENALASKITASVNTKVLKEVFRMWSLEYRASDYTRAVMCVRGLFMLRLVVTRRRRLKKYLHWGEDHDVRERLSAQGCRTALLKLHHSAVKARCVRLAAEKTAFRKRRADMRWYVFCYTTVLPFFSCFCMCLSPSLGVLLPACIL